jgi:hypothetical protein
VPAERELRSDAPAHATGAVEFVDVEAIAADETFRLRPDGDVAALATSLGRLGQLAPVELRPWPGASSDGPRWQLVSGFRRLAATRLLARERVLARFHDALSDQDAWGLALGEALLHEPLTGPELDTLRERLAATGLAPWAEELLDEALVRAPVPAELRERFYEFLRGGDEVLGESQGVDEGGGEGEIPAAAQVAVPVPVEVPDPVAIAVEVDGAAEVPGSVAVSRNEGALQIAAGTPSAGGEADRAADSSAAEAALELTPDAFAADLLARLAGLNQDLATALEAWEDLPADGRAQLLEQARWVADWVGFLEGR